MKRIVFILLLVIMIPILVSAEEWHTTYEWARTYDSGSSDTATSLAVDTSGNVYITGNSATIKYDVNGNELWVKENGFVAGGAIALDPLGNILVTGTRSASVSGYEPSVYATIKYDSSGNMLWDKEHYAWGYYGGGYVNSLTIDSSGNSYVIGSGALVKYDPNGNELWVGGGGSRVFIDPSGNIIVEGGYATTKYDPDGNLLRTIDSGGSVALDSSGNIYLANTVLCEPWYTCGGGYAYSVKKYDFNGNELWSRKYSSGIYPLGDFFRAMTVDSSGNVYATGMTGYGYGGGWGAAVGVSYTTVKYDTDGNELWVRKLGADWGTYNTPTGIVADSSGNVYVTGHVGQGWVYDRFGSGGYVTVKYDSQGDEMWVVGYGGIGYDVPSGIVVDSADNIYITGRSNDDYATLKYKQPIDTKVPIINLDSPQPGFIWPPNKKVVTVTLSGTIKDRDSGVSSASYTVEDEYGIGGVSGAITLTSDGDFSFGVPLEAYRDSQDMDGRVYRVYITARDKVGNESTAATTITVPHDRH